MSPLLFLTTALSPAALALTVEVSPGDDIATITSSLAAGDEIVFTDGVYPLTSNITITGAGTADAPIVLRAADGADPVLELSANEEGNWSSVVVYMTKASFVEIRGLHLRGGTGWDADGTSFYGITLSETTDVTLDDLEVSRTGRSSIALSNNNTRVTIRRAHLHDTRDGDGITAGCSDASCFLVDSVIDNSWIHSIRGDRHAIYLAHGSQGNTVRDTVIYDLDYRGIYLGSTEFGQPNTVEGNAIWQLGDWGMTIYGAARVRNNLVFMGEGGGIYTADPGRKAYEDVVISYNTVADTADFAFEARDWTNAPGVVLSSNAFCNPVGLGASIQRELQDTGVTDLADALITNNVICGLVEGIHEEDGELLPGGGWNDFEDIEGWNLYPTSDAVVLDAGDPASAAWVPETDFNGTTRPGDAPDAGAYEWTQDGNPGWVIQEGYKSLDPAANVPPEVLGGCCKKDGKANGADTGAAFLLPLGALVGIRRMRRRNAATGE